MHTYMPSESTGERLPVRISKELKESAQAVAALRGQTLSGLVKELLKEACNKEKRERPDLLNEEVLKLQRVNGIKRPIAVKSPANLNERKNAHQVLNQKPARRAARKR